MFEWFKKRDEPYRLPGPNYNRQMRTERPKAKPQPVENASSDERIEIRRVTRFFVIELKFGIDEGDHLRAIHDELTRFGDQGWSMCGLTKTIYRRKASYEIYLQREEIEQTTVKVGEGNGGHERKE